MMKKKKKTDKDDPTPPKTDEDKGEGEDGRETIPKKKFITKSCLVILSYCSIVSMI